MRRSLGILSLVLAGALPLGCDYLKVSLPEEYPLENYTRRGLLGKAADNPEQRMYGPAEGQLTDEIYNQIGDVLASSFPPPWSKRWAESGPSGRVPEGVDLANVSVGWWHYQKHCIHCHGLSGDGNGPTAPFLYPRPRDYRFGIFKWKSTSMSDPSTTSEKPTRDDLKSLIRDGALGTSMPPFRLLPDDQLDSLIDYVIYLSVRGELERRLLMDADSGDFDAANASAHVDAICEEWNNAKNSVLTPPVTRPDLPYDSPEYEKSLALGVQFFRSEQKGGCFKCHGNDGKADPARIVESERANMVDDWGHRILPRDLSLGLFRGGRRPVDIYRRIKNGIKGSPMPKSGATFGDDEIWHVVNLVRTLPYRPELLAEPKPAEESHAGGH